MKKQSSRSKSSKSSKKVRYGFDWGNNTIMEDNSSPYVKFKLILDPKEPMYKHEIPKGNRWQQK